MGVRVGCMQSHLQSTPEREEVYNIGSSSEKSVLEIKRKLLPSRHVDPDVKIQVPGTEESISTLICRGKPSCKSKNRFGISSYADLDDLLGEKWHIRITNRNGDFSYVVLSTVSFYLAAPSKMLEYECIQDGDKMHLNLVM